MASIQRNETQVRHTERLTHEGHSGQMANPTVLVRDLYLDNMIRIRIRIRKMEQLLSWRAVKYG